MIEKAKVQLDVYANFACFTNPHYKLDRTSYEVPTPSAIRGILNAVYSKPLEFYYQVAEIQILKPIRFIDIKKNELKNGKIPYNSKKMVSIYRDADGQYTQKSNRYLRDVHYRITAYIVKRPDWNGDIQALVQQFNKRVEKGKCFYQPFMGTKECVCFFEPVDENIRPVDITMNLGMCLYDVFDIRENTPLTKENSKDVLKCTYYNPKIVNGIISVPSYEEILEGYKDAR